MQTRAFNSIAVDYEHMVCTKSSYNRNKLRDEIFYYLNLPRTIANFFPKLIRYNRDYSTYSLEYVPCNTLEELILKNKISKREGKEILIQLSYILEKIHTVKPSCSGSAKEVADFYIKKTLERINELNKDSFFHQLSSQPTIKINGKHYKNFPSLEQQFIKLVRKWAINEHTIKAIHGDFCFSNILYSPAHQTIKLIDPRGSFTEQGIYGHALYDYAKLMHCVHSNYDCIVNDRFELYELGQNHFYFEVPRSPLLDELEEDFITILLKKNKPIEFIYLIEASLFLSMASLHYENKKRQKVLFLTGLILLNQVMEGKYAHMY